MSTGSQNTRPLLVRVLIRVRKSSELVGIRRTARHLKLGVSAVDRIRKHRTAAHLLRLLLTKVDVPVLLRQRCSVLKVLRGGGIGLCARDAHLTEALRARRGGEQEPRFAVRPAAQICHMLATDKENEIERDRNRTVVPILPHQ